MKVSIIKTSDKRLPPNPEPETVPASTGNLLGTPTQGGKFKKPRDSFVVMRQRNQKHTVGITITQKKSIFSKIF